MTKLNLKSELILSKKFSTELSGYNAKEVDEYLDKILSDYKAFEEEQEILHSTLNDKNQLMINRDEIIEQYKLEIETLKSQLKKTEEVSNDSLKKDIEEIKRKLTKI